MTKKEESKDIVKQDTGAVALRRSGGDQQPAGFDGVEEGDIKMPGYPFYKAFPKYVLKEKVKWVI